MYVVNTHLNQSSYITFANRSQRAQVARAEMVGLGNFGEVIAFGEQVALAAATLGSFSELIVLGQEATTVGGCSS